MLWGRSKEVIKIIGFIGLAFQNWIQFAIKLLLIMCPDNQLKCGQPKQVGFRVETVQIEIAKVKDITKSQKM